MPPQNTTPDTAVGSTDTELVRRMSAFGDTQAFDALFERHHRAVYGWLWRMTGDTALSEDLTQETFLRFWRARTGFTYGGASLRTYLFTVARRLLLDVCKRPHIETTVWDATADTTLAAPAATPEQSVLAGELARVLETALAALSPPLREVTLLREVEGLEYTQIAQIIGCPLGTIKSRLSAAREQLRRAVRTYLQETHDA